MHESIHIDGDGADVAEEDCWKNGERVCSAECVTDLESGMLCKDRHRFGANTMASTKQGVLFGGSGQVERDRRVLASETVACLVVQSQIRAFFEDEVINDVLDLSREVKKAHRASGRNRLGHVGANSYFEYGSRFGVEDDRGWERCGWNGEIKGWP